MATLPFSLSLSPSPSPIHLEAGTSELIMRLPELALCHSADCSEQVSNNRQRMVARMNPLYTMLHAYQSK